MEPFEYPREVMNDAKFLLDRLFSFTPKTCRELKHIKILVIGAGSFPSFIPFLSSLRQAYPNVKEISFTLIEPDQAATSRFKNMLPKTMGGGNTLAHFSIHNTDIKSYLENTRDTFDLIYFEHPDVSIFTAVLTRIQLARNTLAISMQESIPYLRKIIKDESVIIASFIFKGDLCEIKSLLKFSLGIKMHVVRQRKLFSDGRYYSLGLIGIADQSRLPNKPPEKLVKEMRLSTILFGLFLLVSVIIFLITPNKLKTVSFFFVIGQLFYNRYGITGWIVRLLLIIGQATTLIMANT